MAWIPMIQEDKAESALKEWYDKLSEPWGGVDNIMTVSYTHLTLPTKRIV